MGNVIDVSAAGEPEAPVLTRTATGGMLGGDYLRSEPLAAYLGDTEVPRYVFRNRKSGLRIDAVEAGDGAEPADANRAETTRLKPASDYQALAAVTDVRVVFVVGTPDGDRSRSVPLSDVVTCTADAGILGGELTITTTADTRYVFPCRGDLQSIADYVDRGAQAWARAYTLLDEAHDSLETAERRRSADDFAAAIDAIDDGTAAIADARDRLAAFGAGAVRSLEPETEQVHDAIERRRREIHAEHGVDAHERARSHWENGEYERAHGAYREATAALDRAQELRATAAAADRLDRIAAELDDLAEAPLSYASAMVEEAEASDDPLATAQCWEVAIERYRDAYALDWGREDDRFHGDPDEIRERVLAALEKLVEHRVDGIDHRLGEAEWLRQSDDVDGAREVLEAAQDALDRTERLVEELSTEAYPALDAARREVEADLALLPEE